MKTDRRGFLIGAGALALGGCTGFPSIVSSRSPNSRLAHACIGTANMAWNDIKSFLGHTRADIVALCDVDSSFLAKAAKELCPKARLYRDWREMLEREDLDSVNVTVPDHNHEVMSTTAMTRGINVYCQKPLAHSLEEIARMRRVAAETGVVTQFGAQLAAKPGDRMTVELLRSGRLGPVRHVWMFSNRKGRSKGRRVSMPSAPVPKTLDWKGWIGVGPFRPYAEGVFHPLLWRTWYDYGSGVIGDMSSHMFSSLWLGMELGSAVPLSVRAKASDDGADATIRRDRWPRAAHVTWTFPGVPASGGEPFEIEWCDGLGEGDEIAAAEFLPPQSLKELLAKRSVRYRDFFIQGKIIECEEGWIVEPHHEALLPEVIIKRGAAPELPVLAACPSHFHEFFDAILEGRKARSDFSWSTFMAEAIFRGGAALKDAARG